MKAASSAGERGPTKFGDIGSPEGAAAFTFFNMLAAVPSAGAGVGVSGGGVMSFCSGGGVMVKPAGCWVGVDGAAAFTLFNKSAAVPGVVAGAAGVIVGGVGVLATGGATAGGGVAATGAGVGTG